MGGYWANLLKKEMQKLKQFYGLWGLQWKIQTLKELSLSFSLFLALALLCLFVPLPLYVSMGMHTQPWLHTACLLYPLHSILRGFLCLPENTQQLWVAILMSPAMRFYLQNKEERPLLGYSTSTLLTKRKLGDEEPNSDKCKSHSHP